MQRKTRRADGPGHVPEMGLHNGRLPTAGTPFVKIEKRIQWFKQRVIGPGDAPAQDDEVGRKDVDQRSNAHGQFLHRIEPEPTGKMIALPVGF